LSILGCVASILLKREGPLEQLLDRLKWVHVPPLWSSRLCAYNDAIDLVDILLAG
jgi:hypothetical protein